jgi:hypothetical protein
VSAHTDEHTRQTDRLMDSFTIFTDLKYDYIFPECVLIHSVSVVGCFELCGRVSIRGGEDGIFSLRQCLHVRFWPYL